MTSIEINFMRPQPMGFAAFELECERVTGFPTTDELIMRRQCQQDLQSRSDLILLEVSAPTQAHAANQQHPETRWHDLIPLERAPALMPRRDLFSRSFPAAMSAQQFLPSGEEFQPLLPLLLKEQNAYVLNRHEWKPAPLRQLPRSHVQVTARVDCGWKVPWRTALQAQPPSPTKLASQMQVPRSRSVVNTRRAMRLPAVVRATRLRRLAASPPSLTETKRV